MEAVLAVALVAVALAVVAHAARARRTEALNRALHELRRPLQVMALSPGRAPGALELAIQAVQRLDGEINGTPAPSASRPVDVRALAESAVERWRGPAAALRRSLSLDWRAGECRLVGDPLALSQALDGLIQNALDHGGLRVVVAAVRDGGVVRITVADSGTEPRRSRRTADPRHGHGLRVVAGIAGRHGGRSALRTEAAGTVAELELPLG